MQTHFADRLEGLVRARSTALTVGIDPVAARLPSCLAPTGADPAVQLGAIVDFSSEIIDLVAPLVPAVKINIAYFEKYGGPGFNAYLELLRKAASAGLIAIGDVKRGDIGHTAELYAAAHLGSQAPADAITVNGFAGEEPLRVFADAALEAGKGIFVWVRASNAGAAEIQDFEGDGRQTMYGRLAAVTARIAGEEPRLGRSGFSNVGMVVAGTGPEQTSMLRRRYPQVWFLVPGYGSQGASAGDCVRFCKSDGTGALINASRSIIFAHEKPRYRSRFGGNWQKAVQRAVLDAKSDLSTAMEKR